MNASPINRWICSHLTESKTRDADKYTLSTGKMNILTERLNKSMGITKSEVRTQIHVKGEWPSSAQEKQWGRE